MISELRGTRKYYSIAFLCATFDYTRQAWYNHLKSVQVTLVEEHIVLEKIIKIRKELVKTKKKWVRTTNSFHRFKIHPDLVQRRPAIHAEEIWVSDITYLRISTGFLYLSLITDAYSRKIVGYHLAADLRTIGCVKALNIALKGRIYPNRPLIHHSDRGTQYCCDDYVTLLKDNKIQISMTQTGSPYDNAIAERVNGILKMEMGLDMTFKNTAQAKISVEQAVHKYNSLRMHTSCKFQTPQATHILENIISK